MRVKVILNPYANRWNAQAQAPLVQSTFARLGVDCDICLTTASREATAHAFQAAQASYDAVVAAGGDGTVSEVVNGLIRAAGDGPTCPLGILPIGTGNDFSDMSGLSRDLMVAADTIASGNTRLVDAGRVNDHFFDNNSALAMEPMVTLENVLMRRLTGNIRYVVALIKSLFKLRAWDMHVRWDEGEFRGPTYLLSVCNGPRTGGLFYMSPQAKMDDGLFDVVYAPEMSKWRVISILPRFFNGSHIQHPLISRMRTRRLVVDSQPGTPIHADGEIIAEAATRVEYEVLPQKITLLVP